MNEEYKKHKKVSVAALKAGMDRKTAAKYRDVFKERVNGTPFELQIVALMGEETALQLEIANRGDGGDLVQIFDGSRYRMRGLDRSLWSPRPSDWCNE